MQARLAGAIDVLTALIRASGPYAPVPVLPTCAGFFPPCRRVSSVPCRRSVEVGTCFGWGPDDELWFLLSGWERLDGWQFLLNG